MTEPQSDGGAAHRKRRWLIAAIVVVLVAILVTVFAVTRSSDTSSPTPTASASREPSESPAPLVTPSAGSATPVPTEITPRPVTDSPDNPVGEILTPIDQSGAPAPGVTLALTSLTAIDGTADEPGEVAGPALEIVVSVTNNTGAAISLQSVVVNADYGTDRKPAGELNEQGKLPLSGNVAPGATAEGTYVFTVPTDQRDLVRISVFTSVDSPTVVFEGAAPR